MSNFSKEALKQIIKECVVEVLQESFSALSLVNEVQSRQPENQSEKSSRQKKRKSVHDSVNLNESHYKKVKKETQKARRSTHLDNIHYTNAEPEKTNAFENKINSVTNTMTSDPILSEIFKDTAMTTLQEQISAESRRGAMPVKVNGDAAAKKMSQSDPIDMFSESAGKWAQLAFAGQAKGAK